MDDPIDFRELARAMNEWARADSHGLSAGSGREGFDHIHLRMRPVPQEPERQITLRARIVDGRPVIIATRSPEPPAMEPLESCEAVAVLGLGRVPAGGGGGGARDPAAVCEGCGALGTVGRAVRTDEHGAATEEHQFCAACWPEQTARYRARWEEDHRRRVEAVFRGRAPAASAAGPGTWFETATWHGTLELVRQLEGAMRAPRPLATEDLARVAAQIRQWAPELEGEMPFEVEAFLQRYGAPAG
jgi:hypothetical protein